MPSRDNKILHYFLLYLVFTLAFLWLNQHTQSSSQSINITKKFPRPASVQGLYLTAYSAGNDTFRQKIIAQMKNSQINTVVIDIKDYSGYILYNSQLQKVLKIDGVRARMSDVRKVIKDFHQAKIYVIARQTVFQDPVLATARPDLALQTKQGNIWRDNKGLAWLDPKQTEVWQYNLDIAKEATQLGFDEINFDYMRYPSDGNMANLLYNLPTDKTKAGVMKDFFVYLSQNLSPQTTISIDTFGLVLDHTTDDFDLNIGQKLIDMVDYFDFICPMMYPSHYPLNYLGFDNSAEHPGEVIAYGLKISSPAMQNKRAKLRPWLQAFNIGAIYDEAKIKAQTQATANATTTAGWLLWNARNYYPDYIF
jgi:hypothetical protein